VRIIIFVLAENHLDNTNMNWRLRELKRKGHDLLDEYISLDKSFRTPKEKIRHAYDKLDFRLSKIDKEHPSHFGMMTNEKEAREAITKLESMIIRRKKKNEVRGLDKVKVAPNLMELQRKHKIPLPRQNIWQRIKVWYNKL